MSKLISSDTRLVGQQYAQQGKAAGGMVRRYIEKVTGLSRAQVTRLIARYTARGRVQVTVYRRRCFAELFTRADIELMASVVDSTPRISEVKLQPVLAAMPRQFPFQIKGFHSDNGSEFINKTVARLLEKLLIEQTKRILWFLDRNHMVNRGDVQ